MATDASVRRGRGKSQKSLDLIAAAQRVLAEIQPASVRAVCYRLFAAGAIPDMSVRSTKRVSVQLVYAREEGIIPWEWIVDETRKVEGWVGWDNPVRYTESVLGRYRRDRWLDQDVRLEVWSEKGTVRGTIAPVLNRYGMHFRVMHGFGSATAVHEAAEESQSGENFIALYVGDWDPSGLYMSEADLPHRLDEYEGDVELRRVALVASDLESLPGFPAATKHRDSRYEWFVSRYGRRCWELDALSPVVLRDRLDATIRSYIDEEAWERAQHTESVERESMLTMIRRWKAGGAR